jgi:predicted  nucleic acid-binding Zn-ribbon protein
MREIRVMRAREKGTVAIDREPITIGRAPENRVVLRDNDVSRHHCVIESAGSGCMIRDLGSHYGTRVNGVSITVPTPLRCGDQIGVGPYVLAYVESGAESAIATGIAAPPDAAVAAKTDPDALARATADRDEARAELASLRRDLDDARAHIGTLVAERDAQADLARALDESRSRESDLRRDLDAARERAARLESAGASLERDVQALHVRLEEIEHERADERERLGGAAAAARGEADRAKRKLAAAGTELAALRRELQQTRRELKAAAQRVRRTDEQRTALEAQLVAILGQLREEVAELRETAGYVASATDAIAALEALFIEADEEIRRGEGDEIPAPLLARREAIADRLETAHAARDDATGLLIEIIARRGSAVPP